MKEIHKRIVSWMLISVVVFIGLPGIFVLYAAYVRKSITDFELIAVLVSMAIGVIVPVSLYVFMSLNDLLKLDEYRHIRMEGNYEPFAIEDIGNMYKESSHGLVLSNVMLAGMIAVVIVYFVTCDYFPNSLVIRLIYAAILANVTILLLSLMHNVLRKLNVHRTQSFDGWKEWKKNAKQKH